MVIHSLDAHGTVDGNTACRRLPFRFADTAPEVSSQWLACDSEKNVMETKYSFSINSLDAVVNPNLHPQFRRGNPFRPQMHSQHGRTLFVQGKLDIWSPPASQPTSAPWSPEAIPVSIFLLDPQDRKTPFTVWEREFFRCTCCKVDLCCMRRWLHKLQFLVSISMFWWALVFIHASQSHNVSSKDSLTVWRSAGTLYCGEISSWVSSRGLKLPVGHYPGKVLHFATVLRPYIWVVEATVELDRAIFSSYLA